MAFTRSFNARIDSGTAQNPALNLTPDDAIQLTFIAEAPDYSPGDLFLDQPAGGVTDPDTRVEIDGVSYSFTYEFHGTIPTLREHGANQVPDQYEGSEVVVITIHDYPSLGEETRFAFMPNESATLAEMDDFGNGSISVQGVDETPPPTPVCFLRGTLILTPRGEVPVEFLRAGDLVLTLDKGGQPVRWISQSLHRWPGSPEADKPILVSAGALGPGRPSRDLVVSPQHRILLDGEAVRMLTGEPEVLVPAKGLLGWPGIRQKLGAKSAEYFHPLFDHHEIIRSDGQPTESFFPGPVALSALDGRQRHEIYRMFPRLRSRGIAGYGRLARPCLTRRATEELADILRGRNRTLVSADADSGEFAGVA